MEASQYREHALPSSDHGLSYFSTPPGTLTNVDRANYPMFGIEYPGMNDVMCGRGGASNGHIGNVRFRTLVNDHKVQYLSAAKQKKPEIAKQIMHMWRSLNPPGRFLSKTTKSDDSLWHDIGDRKAREKVSQCLREKTPEIVPFLDQLHQLKEREEAKASINKEEFSPVEEEAPAKKQEPPQGSKRVRPDLAPSAPLPLVTKSRPAPTDVVKKSRSREEVAEALPTAAELLMEDVFESDDQVIVPDQQSSSMEAYYDDVQAFLDSAPKAEGNDVVSTADRSQMMDAMSACSWVRSIKSVDSEGGGTMLMSIIDGLMNNEEHVASRPTMPQRFEITTRSQKMGHGKSKVGTIGPSNISNLSGLSDLSSMRDKSMRSSKMGDTKRNNVSLMSDLTDLSSFRENNKSSRSNKMGTGGRNNSNYSMLSELTDISEGMHDLSFSGV